MVIAMTVEILAAPSTQIGLRQFVVEIMQETSNMHTPQERNIKLALEAFANYRENQMKGWTFTPFVYGINVGKAYKIPEKADNGLMKVATHVHEPFQVKDIRIWEKIPGDSLFVPSKTGYSVMEVSFQEGLSNPESILAKSFREGLEIFNSSDPYGEWFE